MNFPGRTFFGNVRRKLPLAIRIEVQRTRNVFTARRTAGKTLLFLYDSTYHGLFAHCTSFLYIANWAATYNRNVAFACVGGNYRDASEPENWLPAVLLQPGFEAPRDRKTLETFDFVPFNRWFFTFPFPAWEYPDSQLTLASGRAHFQRSFEFAPAISQSVAETERHWSNCFMVGLHFRGTDKNTEAVQTDHAAVISRVHEVLAELSHQGVDNARVFVATDDSTFLARIRAELGDLILSREGVARSADGQPTHLKKNGKGGNQLARDAMIDAVLLSHCAIMIKTASFLSGFAAMLAERQLVFMLNRPYANTTWFPDSEVLKICTDFGKLSPAIANYLSRPDGSVRLAADPSTSLAPRPAK